MDEPAFRRVNQAGWRHEPTGTIWTRDACDAYWFCRDDRDGIDRHVAIQRVPAGWRVKVELREPEDGEWFVSHDQIMTTNSIATILTADQAARYGLAVANNRPVE